MEKVAGERASSMEEVEGGGGRALYLEGVAGERASSLMEVAGDRAHTLEEMEGGEGVRALWRRYWRGERCTLCLFHIQGHRPPVKAYALPSTKLRSSPQHST